MSLTWDATIDSGKFKYLSSGEQNWAQNESNLGRSENGYFEDNDLAELLFHAVETKAGSPGGRAVLDWAREESILKLRQARQANVCTLNEFRQHLGLKRVFKFVLSSFLVLMTHL